MHPFWNDIGAVVLIASQLSLKDFGKFLRVCKGFNSLSANNFVWRKIHRNEFILLRREVLTSTSGINEVYPYDDLFLEASPEEPYEDVEILNWMCGHVAVENTYDVVIRCKECDVSDHKNWKVVLQDACIARELGQMAGYIVAVHFPFQANACMANNRRADLRPFFIFPYKGRTGAQRLTDVFASACLTEETARTQTLLEVHKKLHYYDVDSNEFFMEMKKLFKEDEQRRFPQKSFLNNAAMAEIEMKSVLTNLRFHLMCFENDDVDSAFIFGSSKNGSAIGFHYFAGR